MKTMSVLVCATAAWFALTSCSEEPGTFALNAAEHPPGPAEQGPALEQLIANPVKRDQVFFANHDFSEKQADYLKGRLDELAAHPDLLEGNREFLSGIRAGTIRL